MWFSLWLAIAQYAPTRDQRLWATEKAVAWIEVAGPLLIKLAQWLSTRRDILGDDSCDCLARLHTQVATGMDVRDVEQRIAKNGNCPEVKLDGTLLGAGAIAQVYKGKMPDGQAVAVKVQPPFSIATISTHLPSGLQKRNLIDKLLIFVFQTLWMSKSAIIEP